MTPVGERIVLLTIYPVVTICGMLRPALHQLIHYTVRLHYWLCTLQLVPIIDSTTSAPTHSNQSNARIMVRHNIRIRSPSVHMEMLKPGNLAVRQSRADIHVVKGLGVHVEGTARR